MTAAWSGIGPNLTPSAPRFGPERQPFRAEAPLASTRSAVARSLARDRQEHLELAHLDPDFPPGSDGTVRLWDARSGVEGRRSHVFDEGQHAVLHADGSGPVAVSPGAWRWLGWLAPDPETGVLTRYPAEVFGALPERAFR